MMSRRRRRVGVEIGGGLSSSFFLRSSSSSEIGVGRDTGVKGRIDGTFLGFRPILGEKMRGRKRDEDGVIDPWMIFLARTTGSGVGGVEKMGDGGSGGAGFE